MHSYSEEIGLKIRTARRAMDLTQEEVARRSGIATSYYGQIERGRINASIDKYIRILKVLELKFEDVVEL